MNMNDTGLSDFLCGGLGLCFGCKMSVNCCKPSAIEDSKGKVQDRGCLVRLSDLRASWMTKI